jgi:predicted metalloprotease
MGPFYCPADEKIYLDLGFYHDLSTRFGAPGEFAEAYVLTHELGHHVQTLLGTNDKVRQLQQRRPDLANQVSVRLELQADCYAGVWGHASDQRQLLDPGEAKEGLAAAASVGDDRLQKEATGSIHPESFTHGSSQQRMDWFQRGFQQGRIDSCDTFAGS